MIRTFSFVHSSHITLYAQLQNCLTVLQNYYANIGGYMGQNTVYLIICITRDSIIVDRIFLVQWKVSILTTYITQYFENCIDRYWNTVYKIYLKIMQVTE